MPYYHLNKRGAGGSIREELIRETVARVTKTNRAFNTTTRSAVMNAQLLNRNVNSAGSRTYPKASLMAGNYSSAAGA